jgi:hypothetical protein
VLEAASGALTPERLAAAEERGRAVAPDDAREFLLRHLG